MESRVKYKIADIEFEAIGEAEFVERERKAFIEDILPMAAEALLCVQTVAHAANAPQKTNIDDCRGCWCNSCAKIEKCPLDDGSSEPDGLRPFPCAGCVNGIRYMPKESEPDCGEYVEADSENYG